MSVLWICGQSICRLATRLIKRYDSMLHRYDWLIPFPISY